MTEIMNKRCIACYKYITTGIGHKHIYYRREDWN